MEPQTPPQNPTQSPDHNSQPAQPVMDVRPPAPESTPVLAKPPDETAKPAPDHPTHPPKEIKKPAKATPQAHTSTQPKTGVGGAIAATVVIVLGLAVLAVYAYLKSQ